jgi:hypothetical protein
MKKYESESLVEVFFDRLLNQQGHAIAAQADSLRQSQIYCGRWLALRRLQLGFSLERLAEQSHLAPKTILFLETGLADIGLAHDADWECYSQLLSTTHKDYTSICRVVALALGCESPPGAQPLVQVLEDLDL